MNFESPQSPDYGILHTAYMVLPRKSPLSVLLRGLDAIAQPLPSHQGEGLGVGSVSYSGLTGVTSPPDPPSMASSAYSFFASTASVGLTAAPFNAKNNPPTFFGRQLLRLRHLLLNLLVVGVEHGGQLL